MLVHLVFLAILPLGRALPLNETCSAEDAQICGRCTDIGCEDEKYNLIGSFTSVSSTDECHEWCTRRNEYMNDCEYLTYYGKGGVPYENTCYIFSSCDKKIAGTGCVTEAKDCYHVPTSTASTPSTTPTHITSTSTATPTKTTTTSSPTTSMTTTQATTTTTQKPCMMHVNGMLVHHHKLEYSGSEETFEISGNLGCQLRVLAIGGGGRRGWDNTSFPLIPFPFHIHGLMGHGAGSGYITISNITFPSESFKVNLRVGGSEEASTIKIDDGSVISAKPGGNSQVKGKGIQAAGDGYSGGKYTFFLRIVP